MPRKDRIDAPGALHHIIVRGIERKNIFRSDDDRKNFLNRLNHLIPETQTDCFAWAFIPNHDHLLLRTGLSPVSVLMSRLLTKYAIWFKKKYRRHGQHRNGRMSIMFMDCFYEKKKVARKQYRVFVEKGIRSGKRPDLHKNQP